MGYMRLDEFEEELSLNLGGNAPAPRRLRRWINFGYINLCTYILFDELKVIVDFPIEEGVDTYEKPSDLLGVVTVEVNARKLTKMRRKYSTTDVTGAPQSYMRRENDFVIWPVPDQDYDDGTLEYVKTPALLVPMVDPDDPDEPQTDLSVLDASWDAAIVMLGTHHGLLSTGKPDEADKWLGRFLGYASSRLKEVDISADVPKMGVNVAWTRDDLVLDPDDILESDPFENG